MVVALKFQNPKHSREFLLVTKYDGVSVEFLSCATWRLK